MTRQPRRTHKKGAPRERATADGESAAGKSSTAPLGKPAVRLRWIAAFLIGINLLVYAPVRNYDFVNYDDPEYVAKNPHVTGGLSWDAVTWAFTTGHQANWHPLTWLSHMVDVQLFGLNPGAHHLTNVLLHTANTLLLFWVLLQMTGALGRSVFIAALFAVHPLHLESVAWIAERKDVLSTLFGLLTLSLYVRYTRQPSATRYAAMVACFAASLMAKPMLVTLPFVLLLVDFWPLGRMTFRRQNNLLKLILEKVPFLILAAISSVVTFVVQQRGGAMTGIDVIPISSRVANACMAYSTYACKMLWPTDLAVLYPAVSVVSNWWLAAASGIIVITILAIWAARRRPYIAVGWFWYLGTLVPAIGLVQVGKQSMADRYTYLPLVGLFLIVAFGVTEMLQSAQARRFLWISGGIVVAACVLQSRAQIQNWSSSTALWEHTLRVTTGNSLAHFNLGAALENEGKTESAMNHYAEALRIRPDYADAHTNLASALMKSGKPNAMDEAGRHLAEALCIDPMSAEAYNAFGLNNALRGKIDDAATHFSEAIRLKPEFALAHNNLGSTLANRGRLDEAIIEYGQAVHIDPNYVDAHKNLGILLAKKGKTNDAVAHFSEVLRINSSDAVARDWMDKLTGKNGATR